jgi:hypothetical protein
MTTVRLKPAQKEKLERASRILRALTGRKLSQGQVIEILVDFGLKHRDMLAASELDRFHREDPFFDLSLTFDLGPTDERTHNRLLYGRT